MAEAVHVFPPFGYLAGQFESVLEMDSNLAREALDELEQTGEIRGERADDYTAVYLRRLHDAEVAVAERIRMLSAGRAMGDSTIARALRGAADSFAGVM